MARVAKQSHLLLTDIIAKLGDNITTMLERVVGRLNKVEKQSDNCSDEIRLPEIQATITQSAWEQVSNLN